LDITNKIREYEQQLKDTENIEITRKQKLEQIDKISNTLKQYKGLTKFNEEVFNILVDKIVIGEKLENGEEDFYKNQLPRGRALPLFESEVCDAEHRGIKP